MQLLSRRAPALALVVVVAVTPVALARPASPAGPVGVPAGVPAAPFGGPVDDGWWPAEGSAFSQFGGDAPPGGGPVWPGVRRDARTTRVGSGAPADVQILHLDPDAPVTIRPTLAGGSVRGVAPVAAQSGDPLEGSVAAVNGGFWLGKPFGEPNGFFAVDGRLVSDSETQGAGPRGTVAWTPDGRMLIDRVDSVETLTLANGDVIVVDGINRGHRSEGEQFFDGVDSILAYTTDYGGPAVLRTPTVLTPAPDAPPIDLAALRIAGVTWPATGAVSGTVTGLDRDVEATYAIGSGEVLVLATGADARALDGVAVGDVVALGTQIRPVDPARAADWAAVAHGLAAGPHILEGGAMTDPAGWESEGFSPGSHSGVRAPRSAIGHTADGRALLVTVDGRQPSTVGFTMAEMAEYMRSIGAVDALSLDGGASSQMVVDGILRNRPCCDAQTRSVATSLQVVHTESFDSTRRLRGAGRVDTAAEVARRAFPDGAAVAVLAAAATFPDALAGGPLAGVLDGPLLLSGPDAVPPVTLTALDDLGVRRVVLLGGEGSLGPGVAADLAQRGIVTVRASGPSRVETAAAIADAIAEEVPVRRAFLATAGGFADALVAAGPGGILGMPILLTGPDRLHPATRAAIGDLDEVVIVGGVQAVDESVADQVRDEGVAVTRLAGTGRFGTAAAVNRWLADQPGADLGDGLVTATGADFPDALAGGPLAAAIRAPLMILPLGAIDADPDAAEFFADLSPRSHVDVLGGLGVVSSYQQWQLEQLTGTAPQPACPVPPVDPLLDCTG